MQKARIKSAQILSPKLVKESDESQQIRKGNNNNVDDRLNSDKQNQTIYSNIDCKDHKVKSHQKVNYQHQHSLLSPCIQSNESHLEQSILLKVKNQNQQITSKYQNEDNKKYQQSSIVQTFFTSNTLKSSQLLQQIQTPIYEIANNNTLQTSFIKTQLDSNCFQTQSDSHCFQTQLDSNCFQCELTKLQAKKLLVRKQITLQQKYWNQKEKMKKQFDNKYNQVWQNLLQKQNIISTLTVQNQSLKIIVQNLQIKLKDQQKLSKKMISNTYKQLQSKQQQLTSLYTQNIQGLKQKYEQKVDILEQQIQKQKRQKNQLNQLNEERQVRLKQRLEQIQEQHQSVVRNIRKHYQVKLALIQQRQQQQIETIQKYRQLQKQEFDCLSKSYQQVIRNKDQLIKDLLLTIEGLLVKGNQEKKRQQDVVNQRIQINIINQIKQRYQQQINQYINYMSMKQQTLKSNYQEKIKSLQRINEIYQSNFLNKNRKTKTIQNNQQHFIVVKENNNNKLLIQSTITQQQLKSNNQEILLKQIQIYKKNQQCLQKQLQNKEKQLTLLQQIIQHSQKHIQQLQINNNQNDRLLKRQLQLLQSKLFKQKQVYDEILYRFQRQIKQKEKQIKYWQNLYQKKSNNYQIQQTCAKVQCVSIERQLQLLKEQNINLKQEQKVNSQQQINNQQQNIQYKQQNIQINDDRKQSQQNKCSKTQQARLDNIINKIKSQYECVINKLRDSYQSMMLQKSEQIKQLSQMISVLIKINFQLNRKTYLCQQDLKQLQNRFNQLVSLMVSYGVSLEIN